MKKLLLLLSAFALVAGLSQCRKPNMPVLNAGETQHVVLNASWDNGGSKIEQAGTGLKWEVGDELTVSDGLEGTLYCSFPDGVFEGNIKRTSGENVTFTFCSKIYDGDFFTEQSGKLDDAVMLSGTSTYKDDCKYDVSMTMPHAVLLLDLSALGTSTGTIVTIKTGGTVVASVAGVKNDATSEALYVAVKVDETSTKKQYTFSGNDKVASCEWTLKTNAFYTLLDGEDPTGDAIVITP